MAMRVVTGWIVLVAGVVPAASRAQSPPPRIERIEVTGTHIPRIDTETGLPVQVITRADIEKGGIQTTGELLERISANLSYGGWNEAQGVGDSRAGYSAPSLRGLGSERTLVLLNGRRLAPYALSSGSAVDVSAIPVSAIDRVEVLKDGASAVYGTDAIGGVINFILRKDYNGAEVFATYVPTEHGGGDSARASAAFGVGDFGRDGYNFFLSVDHQRQEPLRARDREISRTAYRPEVGMDMTSSSSWPGNISQPRVFDPETGAPVRPAGFAGLRNPTVPLSGPGATPCLPPLSFPTIRYPAACAFDFASVIETIPESDRSNVIGRFSWRLGGGDEFFVEGSYYRGLFRYRIAPAPVIGSEGVFPELAPSAPTYPTAFVASLPGGRTDLPVQLRYRLVEFGPRGTDTLSEQWRAVTGLRGQRGEWDYDAVLGYNVNTQDQSLASGYFSESRLFPLITSGAVNPFGANTPEAIDRVRATQVTGDLSHNRASHLEGELRVAGSPWSFAAGPVAVALGAGVRRERLEQLSEPIYYTGDVLSLGTAQPSQEEVGRTVANLFGEVNVALAKGLEANLAVRTDHYSDFGTTTNPKVVLRWQAARTLLLRGAWGTGFRAPTLADLFAPEVLAFVGEYDDPLRCPTTHSPIDCQAFFDARLLGNAGLKPERSKQLNVGFVAEPFDGLSVSLDYYQVRIRDLITEIPDSAIFADYARWGPQLVVRRPPDAATPGIPGRIDYVLLWAVNAGELKTSGFDVDARYRVRLPGGAVSIGITGTYVSDYQVSEFEPVVSGPGNGYIGAIARWRHYATIDGTWGPWGATLAQTFQDGHDEIDLTTCPDGFPSRACTGRRRVGSLEVFDLQARYTGFRNLALSGGVRNLLDRAPPQAFVTGAGAFGYDSGYADPRGRTYYVAARYSFR